MIKRLVDLLIVLASLLASGCVHVPEYLVAREKDLAVAVSVLGTDGKPVAYSEVWRVVTPAPRLPNPLGLYEVNLSLDYLNRVTHRYRDVAEFASEWRPGFRPASSAIVRSNGQFAALVPTDSVGRTKEIIKVEGDRPATFTVQYAALAHGHEPAIVERLVEASTSKIEVQIVLRRTPGTRDSQFAAAFGKLRFEATPDTSRFRGEERLEALRTEMLGLGAAAEAAGEKDTAARIYAWVPYINVRLNFDDTSASGIRIRGYTREEEDSDRNRALIEKAHALDPDNRYVRMKHVLLFPPETIEMRVQALEDLLAGGSDMWPDVYLGLEKLYRQLGRRTDARKVFDLFAEVEPDELENQPEMRKERLAHYVSIEEFRDAYVVDGDVNKVDRYSKSPMRYAIRAGRIDLFDWLVKQGYKLPIGWLDVKEAKISCNLEITRHILESEASVVDRVTQDRLRQTPHHHGDACNFP